MEDWKDNKTIESIGRCIYCGETNGLSREHIIPRSLGGNFVFRNASCESCRENTRVTEEYCCRRGIFFLYRLTHQVRSKHKGEWPREWPLIVIFADRTEERLFPVEEYPIVQVDFPILPPSGITMGTEPTNQLSALLYRHIRLNHKRYAEITKPFQDEGALGIAPFVQFNLNRFTRLLAKIAHGIAVAHFGYASFEHILPRFILGEDDRLLYVVGSIGKQSETFSDMELGSEKPMRHVFEAGIFKQGDKSYAVVRIQLFQNLGAPIYEVVAGEMLPKK